MLLALGLVNGPAPWRGCPGCVPRVRGSHSEKGSCSVSGLLHTAQTAAATAERPGPRGHLAGSSVPPSGCPWGGQTAPAAHHGRLRVFPSSPPLPPRFLTQHVAEPTGGIGKSKFSKQFQYFQYICWGFRTVRGHKRFSTSHTQTLVHFLFLASLYLVGPTQTATLRCSVQPCHGRTPRPSQSRG